MPRSSFLVLFGLSLALAPLGCAGATPATTITAIEAGITDAEIVIAAIQAAADGAFAIKPDPTLQAKIDAAIGDTEGALRAVNTALAGATSISDGNVQAALQAFSDAFSALVALAAQIGVQVSPSAAAVRGGRMAGSGVVLIAPPVILQNLKARR